MHSANSFFLVQLSPMRPMPATHFLSIDEHNLQQNQPTCLEPGQGKRKSKAVNTRQLFCKDSAVERKSQGIPTGYPSEQFPALWLAWRLPFPMASVAPD